MNEIAELNDKFRASTPMIQLLVPDGIDTFSSLLGMTSVIFELVMSYQFSIDDQSDRSKGTVTLEGLKGSSVPVHWEIRERKDDEWRDSDKYAKGYHYIHSHYSVFGLRTRSYDLPELEKVYETRELVVFLPNVKVNYVDDLPPRQKKK